MLVKLLLGIILINSMILNLVNKDDEKVDVMTDYVKIQIANTLTQRNHHEITQKSLILCDWRNLVKFINH